MDLVGAVAELLAILEVRSDVALITGRCNEGWEPVKSGHNAVLSLAGGYFARPSQDHWRPEAAFHHRPLASGKRRLAAIRPAEILGAIVGGEGDDGILVEAVILEVFHN